MSFSAHACIILEMNKKKPNFSHVAYSTYVMAGFYPVMVSEGLIGKVMKISVFAFSFEWA